MNEKYIRADLFMNRIAGKNLLTSEEIKFALEQEPSEDVKPVVHAHWIAKCNPEELDSGTYCRCSNCGASAPIGFTFDWDFCPYCGAKMDEEKS